jgi:hypothetical protein
LNFLAESFITENCFLLFKEYFKKYLSSEKELSKFLKKDLKNEIPIFLHIFLLCDYPTDFLTSTINIPIQNLIQSNSSLIVVFLIPYLVHPDQRIQEKTKSIISSLTNSSDYQFDTFQIFENNPRL